MATQNLTIYLPQDLADEVAAAKAAGTIDPKEVCKLALQEALKPTSSEGAFEDRGPERIRRTLSALLGSQDASWSEVIELAEQVVGQNMEMRANPMITANADTATSYELRFADTLIDASAAIQAIQEAGGWIQSASVSSDGKFLLLITWPGENGQMTG